mgnify:FL=1
MAIVQNIAERLEQVMEVVREQHLDVETAAREFGFPSLDAFFTAFDKHYGVRVETVSLSSADGAQP